MPLQEILDCHQEVAEIVKCKVIEHPQDLPDAEQNCWGAVHVVLARSSNYARAALLLLDNNHWEAAGALTRTIFEDAGVLAYIHSRREQDERFAELYLKSDALYRWR